MCDVVFVWSAWDDDFVIPLTVCLLVVVRKILNTKQLSEIFTAMTSSSTSSTAVLSMKLMWNSPVDAEKSYDTAFAELYELVYEAQVLREEDFNV